MITTGLTGAYLECAMHGRFSHPVDWPHLWHPGDMVIIVTSDDLTYTGMAIDVSPVTHAVLIELEA